MAQKLQQVLIMTLGIVIAVLIGAFGWDKYQARTHASTECVAGADEICPSADLLRSYDHAKSLQDDLNAFFATKDWQNVEAKQDELKGAIQRMGQLQQQEAPGKVFDVNKRKWVKPAPPAAAVAPPALPGVPAPGAPPAAAPAQPKK